MTVEPLTRDQARELGVNASSGLIVTDVQSGGRAADAGIRPGDVISEVDGKPVTTSDALRAALKDGSRPALLLVHRGATTRVRHPSTGSKDQRRRYQLTFECQRNGVELSRIRDPRQSGTKGDCPLPTSITRTSVG